MSELGGRHRGAQVAHVSNRKAGPCTASQRTLPFQTPKEGSELRVGRRRAE